MIKLVASDLDGTLLHNYQQTVPKEIYDTIKALHEKGIIFTAASGRQYANIRRLFAPLGFDHISLKMVPCASIKKRYSPPV